jgi:hypothetical protein
MKNKTLILVFAALVTGGSIVQASPLPQASSTPTPTVTATPAATVAATPVAAPRRLPTGTVVQIDSSWSAGADNILIVNNGQDLDAVVTLSRNNVPMISVYVRAHEAYTIGPIWHDAYTLAFVLGQDWDSIALTFTRQVQPDSFDQPLAFDRNVILSSDGNPVLIQYSYWKAYLGSGRPNDLKSLEELGDSYPFPMVPFEDEGD